MNTIVQALSICSVLFGIPAIAGGMDKQNITLPVACISAAVVLGTVLLLLWLVTPPDKQMVIEGINYKRADCYKHDGFTEKEISAALSAGVRHETVGKHLYIAEDAFIRHVIGGGQK